MERPLGVSVIAVLYFLAAVGMLFCALILVVGAAAFSAFLARQGVPSWVLAGLGAVGAVFCVISAAVLAFIGYGLWTQRNWARIVVIVLSAIGIATGLLALTAFHFGPFLLVGAAIRIGVNAVILWYLLQPQVRQAFRIA
jgi:hypothetical protein